MAVRQKKDAASSKPEPAKAGAKKTPSRKQIAGEGAGSGWNKFVPTDQDRQIVMLAVACGMTQEAIAKQVRFPDGINVKTLLAHFPTELAVGSDRATIRVAGALFATALDRGHKGHPVAAIFWMKTRGRWSESGPLSAVATMEESGDGTGTRRFTLKIGERDAGDDA
jgi:hypothetical protein